MLQGGRDPDKLGPPPPMAKRNSTMSALSSEEESSVDENAESEAELTCKRCGSTSFKAKTRGKSGQRLECTKCGTPA